MTCVHHFEGENETTVEGHDIFFEKIWDRDGGREGFVEKLLYWKLCITPWEVANTVFLQTEWELFPLFCRLFFIYLLWFGYLQAAHSYAYRRYLKIWSGAAPNCEILF